MNILATTLLLITLLPTIQSTGVIQFGVLSNSDIRMLFKMNQPFRRHDMTDIKLSANQFMYFAITLPRYESMVGYELQLKEDTFDDTWQQLSVSARMTRNIPMQLGKQFKNQFSYNGTTVTVVTSYDCTPGYTGSQCDILINDNTIPITEVYAFRLLMILLIFAIIVLLYTIYGYLSTPKPVHILPIVHVYSKKDLIEERYTAEPCATPMRLKQAMEEALARNL